LTVFQILKTYHVVARMASGRRNAGLGGGGGLQAWLAATLREHRRLIEDDLSSHGWNLIAQLEADNPLDALDEWLRVDGQREWGSQLAGVPASFDVAEVLAQMRHEPAPPPPGVGLLSLRKVDMRGEPIPGSHPDEWRYSILTRLTQGRLTPVGVQLPGTLSAFMLGRMLQVDGVAHRMDVVGGSAMKPARETLDDIFTGKPDQRRVARGGRLVAFPLADTRPGTPFAGLMDKLLPYRESFYYFQRMMMASPPGIAGLQPRDYVLEGSFPVAILPDRPPHERHPFQLRGGIALQPHDGTGFIKESVARRMGLFDPARAPLPMFGGKRPAKLPAAGLQHYPRSERGAAETRERLQHALAQGQDRLGGEELFRTLTTANISGPHAVAVPSSDGKVHLPAAKRADVGTDSPGILLGRSPYDKPNLRPIPTTGVGNPEGATAKFLDEASGFQYTFVAEPPDGQGPATVGDRDGKQRDVALHGLKGVLVLIPDELWPLDFADRSVVFSAEDVKTHSGWINSKDRHTRDTAMLTTGILQATEAYGPGSMVAVPPTVQKALDGDFDGDALIIVADRPALFDHVHQFEQRRKPLPSLKPPKSHTPAIDPVTGHYQFGRGRQILSTQMGTLESYSGLLQTYLGQSADTRQWIAERSVFGTYEGLDPHVKRQLREALEHDTTPTSVEQLMAALSEEFARAHNPLAKTVIALLRDQLQQWHHDPTPTRHDTPPPDTVGPNTVGPNTPPPDTVGPLPVTVLTEHLQTLHESRPEGALPPAGQLIDDARLLELLPQLSEVNHARTPAGRVEAILDGFPNRMDIDHTGYDPDDLVQSMTNFLSLGIKVGTDAYKSDTGAHAFTRKANRLRSTFSQAPGLHRVPYAKATARRLHAGSIDPHADRQILQDIPNLAAGLMEVGLDLAQQHHLLAPSSSPREHPDLAQSRTTDAHAAAHALHAHAEAKEPHLTPLLEGIAHQLHTQLRDPHQRLRSIKSLQDQLAAPPKNPGPHPRTQIHNALRYVLVFPDEHFTAHTQQAILDVQRAGLIKRGLKNYFRDVAHPIFRGISVTLATEDGFLFAVQFHTPSSYQAKHDTHHTHKQIQHLERQPTPDHAQLQHHRLHLHQRNTKDQVPLPPQVHLIHDFNPTP